MSSMRFSTCSAPFRLRKSSIHYSYSNSLISIQFICPLSIRRFCSRVYHIFVLHSLFSLSVVVFLVLFTLQATREFFMHLNVSSIFLDIQIRSDIGCADLYSNYRDHLLHLGIPSWYINLCPSNCSLEAAQ